MVLAPKHPAAVGQALRAEGRAVVAGGGDGDHQLIGVSLGGLLEDVVLLGAPVGVHLVGYDDIAVKAVLAVRVACQGVQGNGAAAQIGVGDGVVDVVVVDLPAVGHGVLFAPVLHTLDVVVPVFKGLHGLLERRAHHVHHAAAHPLQDGQRPGQRRHKNGFAVFPRNKNERLLHKALIGSRIEKHQHPVNAELLPGLQKERRAPQRRAVQLFALPVLERALDDADHEIGVPGADLILPALDHGKEALTA